MAQAINNTITIVGSTGLIGGLLTQQLASNKENNSTKIRLVTRKPLPVNDARIEVRVVDFTNYQELKEAIYGSFAVLCAIGTTQKQVKGDKEAYRKVDFDIPYNTAKACKETGCQIFLMVSAVGANSASNNFYLKLKGEVEDAVTQLHIHHTAFFRPSVLIGNRKEFRPGERLAQYFMQPISFLLPSKYRPINAEMVAKAMLAELASNHKGIWILHYKDMLALNKTT